MFTFIEHETYLKCYVWAIDRHGKGTRRRILTALYVPKHGATSPGAMLRLLAEEWEKPYLQRWTPA